MEAGYGRALVPCGSGGRGLAFDTKQAWDDGWGEPRPEDCDDQGPVLERGECPSVSRVPHRVGVRAGICSDAKAAVVRRGGVEVTLSSKEYQLLRYLVERRGEVITRETLLREVWGYERTPNTRTIDVHMTWLRQKMEPDPSQPTHFLTVRGIGYRFDG